MVILYFSIPSHKKILIRRSTIVLLPNAFLGSTEAPQLPPQNYRWARNYSTLTTERRYVENFQLDPWWVTGFTDGEGCFDVSIIENKNLQLGWEVQHRFAIALHVKDKALLQYIQSHLGVGKIYKHGPKALQFRVKSFKELDTVINHFKMYPLMTNKCSDLKLFIMVHEIMRGKEHLTQEGLIKILAIKASMNHAVNHGLSGKLQLAFPSVVPVVRPLVKNLKVKDPNWLVGFTSADGCFIVNLRQNSKYKTGFQVILKFIITQHARDECLLKSLMEFLDCGNVTRRSREEVVDLIVTKLSDINNKIIPLFQKYPIHGVKAKDFADWCSVVELINEKKHLTEEGLEQIRWIKAGMNTGRNN